MEDNQVMLEIDTPAAIPGTEIIAVMRKMRWATMIEGDRKHHVGKADIEFICDRQLIELELTFYQKFTVFDQTMWLDGSEDYAMISVDQNGEMETEPR